MLSVRKPSSERLRRYLAAQAELSFTYPGIGATREGPPFPGGYAIDHTRVELGRGAEVFQRARASLARWEQFRLGWVEPFPGDTPLVKGQIVAVLVRAGGLWWTSSARIVYTIDEVRESVARYGFAYGTLPGHAERGEERFVIDWDRRTDRVWFDILAFSRPRHWLARLGRWRVRAMQKRFAREAPAAMRRRSSAGIDS
jgi:uncharacterized protein (UPF0548 family)